MFFFLFNLYFVSKPLSEESSTITTTQTTNTVGAGLYKETQSQSHSGSGHCRTESVGSKGTKLNTISYIHRRSSDSDLSITPKGLCPFAQKFFLLKFI